MRDLIDTLHDLPAVIKTGRTGIGLAIFLLVAVVYVVSSSVRKEAGSRSQADTRDKTKTIHGTGPGERERTVKPEFSRERMRTRILGLRRVGDPVQRTREFAEMAQTLEAHEFEDAIRDYRALNTSTADPSDISILFNEWARVDPVAAATFAQRPGMDHRLFHGIMETWTTQDPEAAFAFATKDSNNPFKGHMLVGVVQGMASQDRERATEIMGLIPSGQKRGAALRTLVGEVLRGGVDEALAWGQAIEDPETRKDAVAHVMFDLAAMDPARSVEVLASIEETPAAAWAASRVGIALAREDPVQAMAWAEEQGPNTKDSAVRGVVMTMGHEDPKRASQWLDTFDPAEDLEQSRFSLAWAVRWRDPAVSATWGSRLKDPKAQRRVIRTSINSWLQSDPEAAQAWLDSPDVPDAVRAHYPKSVSEQP